MKTITIGDHAVVLGATMPALAVDAYDRVTVVERDILVHDMPNRRGATNSPPVRGAQLKVSASQLVDFLLVGTTFRPRGTMLQGEQS